MFNKKTGETVLDIDMRDGPSNELIKVTLDESPNKPNNL